MTNQPNKPNVARKPAPYSILYALRQLEDSIEWSEMYPDDPASWMAVRKMR